MNVFCFIDRIAEVRKNESLTAFFTLKGSEEFLKDHFDGFPVMPGVLLLESLRQAASSLLLLSGDFEETFYVFSQVEAVKFGQFVKPGSVLKLWVHLLRKEKNEIFFEGRIDRMNGSESCGKALTVNFSVLPVESTADEKAVLRKNSRLFHRAIPVGA